MWTDERKQRAIELWREGFTGTQIACEIGGVTRNAVLGVLHRNGCLAKRNQGAEQRIVNRIRHNAKARREDKSKLRLRALNERRTIIRKKIESPIKQLLKDLPTEPLPPVDPLKPLVSFNDLDRKFDDPNVTHHCKAPLGLVFSTDRPYYCGRQRIEGVSYCAEHARRYFYTPTPYKAPRGNNVNWRISTAASRLHGSADANAKEFLETT